MISVEGLRVEFGGFTLFDDVSFVINKKDRIALVGKNGAGKSTMLKILAGLQSPTGGVVSIPKETTIGYLPQQMQLKDIRTVREEAEMAFDHIHDMEREINLLNEQLAERTDYESEAYHKIIDKVTHLSEQFQMMGGSNYHAELERTLMSSVVVGVCVSSWPNCCFADRMCYCSTSLLTIWTLNLSSGWRTL